MVNDLRRLPHFKKIKQKTINDLISAGEITRYSCRKGVTVHEQGTGCQGVDIVWSGKLTAYSLAANGSETIVFEFGKGNIVGANLLFGDQNTYPMNIYCIEDSIFFHISKGAIIELLKEYGFVIPFVKSLSSNSQGMNQKIAMYTRKSLRGNLMEYFTALSVDQNSKSIILPISKKQLADHLGVQRPSLFRELKRMKDEGLVEINNRTIRICDMSLQKAKG